MSLGMPIPLELLELHTKRPTTHMQKKPRPIPKRRRHIENRPAWCQSGVSPSIPAATSCHAVGLLPWSFPYTHYTHTKNTLTYPKETSERDLGISKRDLHAVKVVYFRVDRQVRASAFTKTITHMQKQLDLAKRDLHAVA